MTLVEFGYERGLDYPWLLGEDLLPDLTEDLREWWWDIFMDHQTMKSEMCRWCDAWANLSWDNQERANRVGRYVISRYQFTHGKDPAF